MTCTQSFNNTSRKTKFRFATSLGISQAVPKEFRCKTPYGVKGSIVISPVNQAVAYEQQPLHPLAVYHRTRMRAALCARAWNLTGAHIVLIHRENHE